jgi:EpsI family protein
MSFNGKSIALLALMVLAMVMGEGLRARTSLADERAPIDLVATVPTAFGDWHEDVDLVAQVVNPQQRSALDKIYTQTLSRTYVNHDRFRIMLSIAYGRQQSDELRVHQPEGCYQGQGFHTTLPSAVSEIATSSGLIPVTRLAVTKDQRHEPITYWIRIGDGVARTQWEMKELQLDYAIKRQIPDGMVVRISSISSDDNAAFALQQNFIDAMLAKLDAGSRQNLIGKLQK